MAVSDTGTGIAADVLDRVFEPFFTTKEVGKGSGLGLSQVVGVAQQLGGGVRVETRLGQGTTVKICLKPIAPGQKPEPRGETPVP
jgi:signal transduction histidine kinase